MRNIIKGMIIFFLAVIVFLVGLLVYALVRGEDAMPSFVGGFGSEKLINTQNFSIDGVDEINISMAGSEVYFKESNSTEIVIKEYGTKQYKESFVEANAGGSVLNIKEKRDKTHGWLVFGNRYHYIEVYLPADYQDKMAVSTSSGDISANINLTFSDLTVKTSSGYAELDAITADQVKLQSSSGDLSVDGELTCKELSVKASSGYIRLDTVNADRVSFETTSGDISANVVKGTVNCESSSGYIRVDEISGSGEFSTSSGDISMSFAELSGDLDIETSSGYVKCGLPADAGFDFTAETSSGDISTFFDDTLGYSKDGDEASGSVGKSTDCQVDVHTSSGDIRITED